MYQPKLTIFTPTYNRAYSLPKLYQSLCCQKFTDFEWIVVDDGSTDGTAGLIDSWKAENKLNIRYFHQDNSGKMSAHNLAVSVSEAVWFLCIDSDDYLTDENVFGDFFDFWSSNCKNSNVAGVADDKVCGVFSFKEIEGRFIAYPTDVYVSHLRDIHKRGCTGEAAMFLKTSIIKKHLYPIFEGERFVPDAYLYEQLDASYQFLLMPRFTQHCKYNPDGYTHKYRFLLYSNPLGYRAYHNQRVALRADRILHSVICSDAISIRCGFRGLLSSAPRPFLALLMFPIGLVKYLLDSIHLKTFGRVC